jgi:hypothetical protein
LRSLSEGTAVVYLDSTNTALASTNLVLGLMFWAVLIGLYWVPTIIAAVRHHHDITMIAIINGLLGWTIIGWVVALANAFSNPPPAAPVTHVYTRTVLRGS